jgi:hypothetical protein
MADEMTGLLTPSMRSDAPAPADGRRPLVVGAALAGAAAAATVLVGCMALALAAWFSADQGSHGTTRDALRIGADAWLLAHGASLEVGVATITVVPLGLTLICGYVCFRLGRWAAQTSYAEDGRAVALATVVMSGIYALVAIVVALLATTPDAEPSLGRAFGGGFVVALLGGGPGLVVGSGQLSSVLARLPESVRSVGYAGVRCFLGVFAAGGVLVTVALMLDLGAAANVLSRLQAGNAGGALITVLVAGFAPNAALFGTSYLVGPGFAVGTGTAVSTSTVALGPVPAFPLLAALPSEGPAPWWAVSFQAVPVVVAVASGWLGVRAFRCTGYDVAALRGLLSGIAGGLLLGIAMALSGGAAGPGRMEDVGTGFVEPTLLAMLSLGLGCTLGAVLARWRYGPAPDGTEETVDLSWSETTVAIEHAADS